jgi:hypothetical protein
MAFAGVLFIRLKISFFLMLILIVGADALIRPQVR